MKEERTYRKQPTVAMKREWIKLYYQQGVSVKSISDQYGYPVYTIYRVLQKINPNRKERSDKGKSKSPKLDLSGFIELQKQGESAETILENFIYALLDAIAANPKITAKEGLAYTSSLMKNLKLLRSMQLTTMIKEIDIKILEALVRRYEPDASDLRVIQVIKEVIAEIKAKQ